MKLPISLSIFFPAHNEEENIAATIASALLVAEQSPYVRTYEIIIVDDGSTDNTASIARDLARTNENIRVISHPINKGYGAALKTGLAAARMEYVFFTDADLQFDIVEMQNLLVHLPDFEVVVGYRAPRQDPWMRLLNARGWNILNRIFFGLHVRDIDCAFKIFKRALIQNLVLSSEGAMINAEILIKLKQAGVAIKEVPVSHLPRRAGSPTGAKPSVIFRALREMVTLYGGELGSVTQKQALRFFTVGVLNTGLDAAAYIAFTRGTIFFAEHLVTAKFLSFMVGTVSSLILNRAWTFEIRGRYSFGEIMRFYTTVSVSLAINLLSMQVLLGAGVHDLAALVLATGLTFLTNFTLSRSWVFKKSAEPTPLLISQ
jgi:glycosyltransferase involved in cell wall biosynthesis